MDWNYLMVDAVSLIVICLVALILGYVDRQRETTRVPMGELVPAAESVMKDDLQTYETLLGIVRSRFPGRHVSNEDFFEAVRILMEAGRVQQDSDECGVLSCRRDHRLWAHKEPNIPGVAS